MGPKAAAVPMTPLLYYRLAAQQTAGAASGVKAPARAISVHGHCRYTCVFPKPHPLLHSAGSQLPLSARTTLADASYTRRNHEEGHLGGM